MNPRGPSRNRWIFEYTLHLKNKRQSVRIDLIVKIVLKELPRDENFFFCISWTSCDTSEVLSKSKSSILSTEYFFLLRYSLQSVSRSAFNCGEKKKKKSPLPQSLTAGRPSQSRLPPCRFRYVASATPPSVFRPSRACNRPRRTNNSRFAGRLDRF